MDARTNEMDWAAIAEFLAENSETPVAVLDSKGNIRMFSSAMELLIGWGRDEVEGRSWEFLGVSPAARTRPPSWLSKALRGELKNHRTEILTRSGRRMVLALEVSPVGRSGAEGLLVAVRAATPVGLSGALPASGDFAYRIVATASDFGKLTEIDWLGGANESGGEVCFTLLHEREEPCSDCPALRPVTAPWPRVSVRREHPHADRVQLVTAEPADASTVRLRVRVITDRELGAIQNARNAALAQRAHLTVRETTVFGHILEGRSLDEISTVMSLSRRTVKFHQSNIFQKVGTDSRVDLIRLMLF